MKILFISHAQYITVALPKIIEMAEQLVKSGHDITLLVTHKNNMLRGEEFTKNGVHYLLSPSMLIGKFRHGADPFDVINRLFILKGQKFDVIHAIDSRPTVIIPALYFKKKLGVPLVLEWSDWYGRGGTISERSGLLYNRTIAYIESFFEESFRLRADGATVVGSLLYNRLVKMGFPRSNIHIHRMGCNIDKFLEHDKFKCRKKLRITRDLNIFSYFGRIHDSDHKLLLKSFTRFNELSDEKNRLFIIGEIEPMIDQYNDNIVYTGRVTDNEYLEYITAADVCLLPLKTSKSNMARWPSKFTDYLAAGKPVVATNVSDFGEIFQNSNIGILSKNDSIDEFIDALSTMLSIKDRWKTMGKNARDYATRNLDWKIITRKYIDFVQKL